MTHSKLFKVTPENNSIGGNFLARSFGEFNLRSVRGDLCSLSAMLGADKFTEVYFKTTSGNIYKFLRERNEFGQPDKWVLINKNKPTAKYYPTDAEMFYTSLEVNEKFLYGNGGCSTEITEIVCVNTSRKYFDMDSVPEATLVQQFYTKLKGQLAVNAILGKM